MLAAFPTSLFAGANPLDHVYIYTKFGSYNSDGGPNRTPITTEYFDGSAYVSNSFESDSTFEEWAIAVNPVPEPGAVALLGVGALVLATSRNRRIVSPAV
jgi:hypothetical protein